MRITVLLACSSVTEHTHVGASPPHCSREEQKDMEGNKGKNSTELQQRTQSNLQAPLHPISPSAGLVNLLAWLEERFILLSPWEQVILRHIDRSLLSLSSIIIVQI